MTPKHCEQCKKEFQCGADEIDCWCFAFEVNDEIPKKFSDCLCIDCLRQYTSEKQDDFFLEDGKVVFTEAYHLKRGYCCKSSAAGCRHCPYR